MQYVEQHLMNLSHQGGPVDWKRHEWVADLTSFYNYGCDFVSGRCAGIRLDPDRSKPEMACCQGCASYFGYFDYIDAAWSDFYLQNYDYLLGFWRPEGGCIIPRPQRSYRCNKYICAAGNLHTGALVRKLYEHYELNRFSICEHFRWNDAYRLRNVKL